MTASEFQIIMGGKGLFLAPNRCYKNQSLPSTSCHAKTIPKIGKVNFVKKIDMLNIFHMPPSETMWLYWGLCKVSYSEGVFLSNFTTFDCFEDNLGHF